MSTNPYISAHLPAHLPAQLPVYDEVAADDRESAPLCLALWCAVSVFLWAAILYPFFG